MQRAKDKKQDYLVGQLTTPSLQLQTDMFPLHSELDGDTQSVSNRKTNFLFLVKAPIA